MITNIYVLICALIFIYIQFIQHGDKWGLCFKTWGILSPIYSRTSSILAFYHMSFYTCGILSFLDECLCPVSNRAFLEACLGTVPYLYLIVISMILSSMLSYSASQISSHYYQNVDYWCQWCCFWLFLELLLF